MQIIFFFHGLFNLCFSEDLNIGCYHGILRQKKHYGLYEQSKICNGGIDQKNFFEISLKVKSEN